MKQGLFFSLMIRQEEKSKKTRFNIDTGLPPWNMPFDVPSNL